MHGTAHKLSFFALLGVMASLAYALNFQYYSDNELTPFGDRIRWWHGDTLCGPVRTNDTFSIMGDPVFCDYVIQGSDSAGFIQGPGYNPIFLWDLPPFFNAPDFPFPTSAPLIRQRAYDEGFFFSAGPDMQAWLEINHDMLVIRWAPIGQPFDTTDYETLMIPDSANVFFEAPLKVSGTVSTILILGASGRIGLDDNLVYASSQPPNWEPVAGHPEKLAVVSENEIKVLNTVANGRENSSGGGFTQPDPALTSISLNGIFVAMGESFTFDEQNDPDSGNVCICVPDDRGTIHLFGSLLQHRRNYVHRSNNMSTGYLKNYRYDNDLKLWNFGLYDVGLRENSFEPESINFGTVAVGDTAWDTLHVYNDFVPVWLSMIQTSGRHFVVRSDSSAPQWQHHIAIGFAPDAPGELADVLMADIPYYDTAIEIPLSGTGRAMSASDPPFIVHRSSLNVYPNPFNSRAMIRFSLQEAADASLVLYDVLGREMETLAKAHFASGEHSVSFDGTALSAGLYFARLTTPSRQMTTKLLLIK